MKQDDIDMVSAAYAQGLRDQRQSDEALLRKALEALEWADNGYEEGLPIQVAIQATITALKAALAEDAMQKFKNRPRSQP